MPIVHRVKQGEHLSSIAERWGFEQFETIWQAPENAALRERRDPHVLLPGDELVIPEKGGKSVAIGTGQRHTFVVRRSRLELVVALEGILGAPQADRPVEVEVDGEVTPLTTDGAGRLYIPLT